MLKCTKPIATHKQQPVMLLIQSHRKHNFIGADWLRNSACTRMAKSTSRYLPDTEVGTSTLSNKFPDINCFWIQVNLAVPEDSVSRRNGHVNHLSIIAATKKLTAKIQSKLVECENELIHCHCKDAFHFQMPKNWNFPSFSPDNNGNKSPGLVENNKVALETRTFGWSGLENRDELKFVSTSLLASTAKRSRKSTEDHFAQWFVCFPISKWNWKRFKRHSKDCTLCLAMWKSLCHFD